MKTRNYRRILRECYGYSEEVLNTMTSEECEQEYYEIPYNY